MHTNFKLWLVIGIMLLAFSGCVPLRLIPAPTATTSATITATPLPAKVPRSGTQAPAPPITSLQMIDQDNGWAWTNSVRLLRTTDGGQTWVDRTPAGQVLPGGSFFLDAQTAWLSIFFQENNRFGLLHTTDGGLTWTQYPYGGTQTSYGLASGLHFTDALNGWAEDEDIAAGSAFFTLSETHDGGKTWAPIPVTPPQPESGLPPGTLHLCSMCDDSFYYDPGRMIIVYGDMLTMQPSGSVRMQVSFDLGKTWQTQNLPLPQDSADALVAPYQPAFFGDKNGLLPISLVKMNSDGSYAYQRLAFYTTQDGGASWTLAPGMLEPVAPFTQVQIVSPGDIYVLCGNALCASHDGAQTWKTVVSNLDFTQNDKRSIWLLDFLNANTAWASVTENDITTLYKTTDGGGTWTKLTPLLAALAPVTVNVDTSIPTPTLIPTSTIEPTPTPDVAFDQNANAYRIRFAPYGTWVEINDTISVNMSKRYTLSAMQGQIMSVSIPQGPAFSVNVAGADKKSLSDSLYPHPFWRGALPSTQDYIVTVESQVSGPFTLRIAINPVGQASQNFWYFDSQNAVGISYTDEFVPTSVQVPVNTKGTPLFTLAFIDPTFYSPTTNLSEAYLLLTATTDPAVVSTCTQPSTQFAETVTGQVSVNNYTFTRSEFVGAAAGNVYDQISYRTVVENKCFEVIFLIHSTNIGNYPAGTVVEFDRDALLSKFEAVLNTFLAK